MYKEGFFKDVTEMLPDPIFAIDKDGKIILWNSAMEKLTKVKRQEILGKGDYTYSEIFYGYKRPTLADFVLKPDEELERKYYINFRRNADGAVEGEAYSSKLDYYDWGKAVPIFNDDGDIEAVISISRDISRNIKYQKQRDILLKRYETLFVNSPDAIACFDKEHIIFDVNESFLRIFGYTREECIGKNLDDLVVPKSQREEAVKKTDELFEKGIVDVEAVRYTKTGIPIAVNIRAILMKIDNEILGGYGIYTDVSEKVKYKEELESANLELEATVEQLMSNEEELRAQYDEIQKYSEINEELKQKYEIAIEATDSFIWEIVINKGTINFSKNFVDLVGADAIKKENIYEIIKEIVHEEDRDKLINEIKKYQNEMIEEIDTQIRIIDKNNNIHWYLIRGKGIKNREGKINTLHGVLVEITRIKKQEQFIKFLADHDPLTGLYNRRKFREILDNELADNKKGALFLLDIDDFKNINDILGHVYGDELLRRFAKVINDMANENIVAFRFGGDEFLILIKEEEFQQLVSFADRLVKALKDRIVVDYFENNLTVSMGIVQFPNDGDTIDELLIKADIAMYNAKKAGKNRYFLFDEQMKLNFNYKISIENMLRKALKKEAFFIVYQPIVETRTGKVSSLEALLRIRDSHITPDKFIPIAEETGLILPIGKWVIKEVVKQISRWAKRGYESLPVAINLSPRQFYDASLIDYMKKVLEEYDVDPSLLEIEITENVFAEKRHETVAILNRLKNLGVRISLDDFGAGYSSLNYLTFMPIDKVKLDKTLKDKFVEFENIKIMDSLIALVHGLNLKVVTEGVEEIEEYEMMKRAGSDFLQGYLFSKPLAKADVEKIFYKNYNELLKK
ncbi:MAG: EAL domain-containing protein [Clostridiales bacterium]|nr:EAL domain-containing protein [Clostridiales bacterium]